MTQAHHPRMHKILHVLEPHPSVPKSGGYIGGGRGGAGNFKRYHASEVSSGPDATGPASRVQLHNKPAAASRERTVIAGRGGAGNMFKHTDAEEPLFKFDEELSRRQQQAGAAPVYRVGRGGAGNTFDERSEATRTTRVGSTDSSASAASSNAGSEDGSSSAARRSVESALGRISRKFSSRP